MNKMKRKIDENDEDKRKIAMSYLLEKNLFISFFCFLFLFFFLSVYLLLDDCFVSYAYRSALLLLITLSVIFRKCLFVGLSISVYELVGKKSFLLFYLHFVD